MPKQKTRKSLVTRFKLTKTGKLLHRHGFSSHLKRKKSKSQKRRAKKMQPLKHALAKKIKKIL